MSARLTILYNEPVLPADHPDAASEHDVVRCVADLEAILRDGGFDVSRWSVGEDLQALFDLLRRDPPDAIFNLFEGLADRPATETTVAGIMEWFGVPFTGCGSETLTLARDKQRTKYMLQGAGVPTAPFISVEKLPCPAYGHGWPAIVKPAGQDASIGVEQASVVTNQDELERRVAYVLERYGAPVLVERYIAGRELTAYVTDAGGPIQVLPISEIAFQDAKVWPIYSYTAKWNESSAEYAATPEVLAGDLPAKWSDRLREITLKAYRLLGCRDYARVDFRMTAAGEPFVLELNPNPYLMSQGLSLALEAARMPHGTFVCDLARAALGRRRPADGPVRRQSLTGTS